MAREASFHRAALLLGLTTGDAVITWADDLIAREVDGASRLLDLAMIPPHDLSELRHALEPISVRTDSPDMLRALFDIARRDLAEGRRSAKDTLTVLGQARSFLTLPDEQSLAIQTLMNDHMLATAGLRGDIHEVELRTAQWMAQFEHAESEFMEESRC